MRLFDSLKNYSNIKHLQLGSLTNLGGDSRVSLSTMLQKSITKLKTLELIDCIDDGILASLVVTLPTEVLQRLNLRRNPSISSIGWATLMPFLQSCKLKKLILCENRINDEFCAGLATSLANNSTLNTLNIGMNPAITSAGFVDFSALLRSPVTRLESLILFGNGIDDVAAVALADSLSNNRTLRQLWLGDNSQMTSRGYIAFSDLLQNINCRLNCLSFMGTNFFGNATDKIGDDSVIAFAASLVNSIKLTELNLGVPRLVTLDLRVHRDAIIFG